MQARRTDRRNDELESQAMVVLCKRSQSRFWPGPLGSSMQTHPSHPPQDLGSTLYRPTPPSDLRVQFSTYIFPPSPRTPPPPRTVYIPGLTTSHLDSTRAEAVDPHSNSLHIIPW
ncbi:hypothetical protein RSOLAG1IB_07239 [Rhizoctonia solani AG-1 IB]|uniref:Uncharacterized protein n=1 Tax=Thanatephorus cucumeris (strain AG1-IB / isolate 7/3/14) TaxID=1108050 RepID=A0A0B7FAY7_THACB|nr:hypothetical protein RSOLAG1IB_07239 [Rhizoctonia solani AG-1 IB]